MAGRELSPLSGFACAAAPRWALSRHDDGGAEISA